MESFNWTPEQQEDVKTILKPILDYLQEQDASLFKEGVILVVEDSAILCVPIGLKKPEEGTDSETLRLREEFNQRMRSITIPILRFLKENAIGSPLYGYLDNTDTEVIVRFGLKPNDILGAEKAVARSIRSAKSIQAREMVGA